LSYFHDRKRKIAGNMPIAKITVRTKNSTVKTMELILHRRFLGEEYVIGSLYINNEYFCDALEDKDRGLTQSTPLDEIRKIKIPHETPIPTGIYKVIVNLSPAKRRMLPRLLDVPGFSGALIHRGNTKNDSSGCILAGENKVKGRVVNSAEYEKRLVKLLTEAQERGEEIRIKIMVTIQFQINY
jgi:hypothetical protein